MTEAPQTEYDQQGGRPIADSIRTKSGWLAHQDVDHNGNRPGFNFLDQPEPTQEPSEEPQPLAATGPRPDPSQGIQGTGTTATGGTLAEQIRSRAAAHFQH